MSYLWGNDTGNPEIPHLRAISNGKAACEGRAHVHSQAISGLL